MLREKEFSVALNKIRSTNHFTSSQKESERKKSVSSSWGGDIVTGRVVLVYSFLFFEKSDLERGGSHIQNRKSTHKKKASPLSRWHHHNLLSFSLGRSRPPPRFHHHTVTAASNLVCVYKSDLLSNCDCVSIDWMYGWVCDYMCLL